MVAPDRRERKRYIGFRLVMDTGPAPDRSGMVRALDVATRAAGLPDKKRLTVFTGELGIVRCEHLEQGAMIDCIGSIQEVDGKSARAETLITSGTIKKVKGHLGLDRDA
jgi:RNase P/RNase MRP subunit POP5